MLGDLDRLTLLLPLFHPCSFSLLKLFFKLPKAQLKSPFSKKSFCRDSNPTVGQLSCSSSPYACSQTCDPCELDLPEQPQFLLPLSLNQNLLAPGTGLGTQKEGLICQSGLKSVGNGPSS